MAVTVVVPGNWATAPARYVSFSAGTCHCPSGGRQANFDQIARDVTQPIFVMMGVASYRLRGAEHDSDLLQRESCFLRFSLTFGVGAAQSAEKDS